MPQIRAKGVYFKALSGNPRIIYYASSVLEYLLTKTAARILESFFKKIQTNKITASISEGKVKEHEIIFDDYALVFHHPRPLGQRALVLYEKNLKELGLI